MEKKRYIKEKKIAHRGVHENHLENTIPSFREAMKRGYAIELDIQFTKDEKIVVFHDESLKRIFGVKKYISFLTYKEIEQYYSCIPLLSEVLELVRGKVTLLIEIKWDKRMKSFVRKLIDLLKNYQGEVYLMSFYLCPFYYLKRYHSPFKFGYLLNRYLPNYSFLKLILKFNLFRFDFLVVDLFLLKDPIICQFYQKNYLLGYTICCYQEYFKYQEYADNFIWESYHY